MDKIINQIWSRNISLKVTPQTSTLTYITISLLDLDTNNKFEFEVDISSDPNYEELILKALKQIP